MSKLTAATYTEKTIAQLVAEKRGGVRGLLMTLHAILI